MLSAVVQLLAIGPANQEQNQECSATGFLINEEGYLITNWHVVDDARRCLEKAPGAKLLAKLAVNDSQTAAAAPCEVIALDPTHDLALLKIGRPLLTERGQQGVFAPLENRPVLMGEAVTVSGHPAFAWQPVSQAGHVVWIGGTRLAESANSLAEPSDAVMVDIHLRPGNSGSPVYRAGGGVVAVIDKRDSLRPSYSIAVAIHYAIELAEHNGVRWHGLD